MNDFWSFIGELIKTIVTFIGIYALIALLLLGALLMIIFK